MDRIAIIGTGNVAWHITRLLLAHQYEVEVLGRKTRENSGFTFANSGFRYINSITSLSQDAILYLICTGDDQIVNAAKALHFSLVTNKFWHTHPGPHHLIFLSHLQHITEYYGH